MSSTLSLPSIIATIGPSTLYEETIRQIVHEGVNYFRLNFSHGSYQWHADAIALLRGVSPHIPIILDTKGPEIRTGDSDVPVEVKMGDELLLCVDPSFQTSEKSLVVSYAGLGDDVQKGDKISLDSGLIILEVLETTADYIRTRVKHDGVITSRRHVNLIEKDVSLPTITQKDYEDISFGLDQGIDMIALSFCRDAQAVEEVKKLCKAKGKEGVKIIAKIENAKGLENRESIAQVSDGLMCARGDLGVEMDFSYLPYYQVQIIKAAKKYEKMAIVATEMLESMIHLPRPTRAEITDVSMAVWQGASSVMLSGETANGECPVDCVRVMKKIMHAAKEKENQMMNSFNSSV